MVRRKTTQPKSSPECVRTKSTSLHNGKRWEKVDQERNRSLSTFFNQLRVTNKYNFDTEKLNV